LVSLLTLLSLGYRKIWVEEENRKLQKLVAEQALDMMVLKELLSKKS
jgi:hypothetical protein